MLDPLGESALDNAFDIEFSVPMTHRLRFTEDCLGKDFGVLRDLFEPSSAEKSRVQVWLDGGLLAWEPELAQRIRQAFDEVNEIDLVRDVQALPGGEAVKNDPTVINELLRAFDEDGLDRRSYVTVIGGGAILDAVGYAASIAHRGIRLIRLPTTTLAQCDSGVGVKNAVNWFGKKNWKGTFATPWAVVNDVKLLEGLSDRDFRCGFSEAVKVSLLKDPELFDFLHDSADRIAKRDPAAASRALRESVLLHLKHITQGGDPFEQLQARPLDFGHWSAHKLESITNYQVRHGEAVAIGVAVDVAYSYLSHGLPLEVAERTFDTLRNLQLPIWHESLESEVLFEGLEEFRQHLGGELTITLVEKLGQPINVHTINHDAMREAMQMAKCYARQTDSTLSNESVSCSQPSEQ